MNEFAETLREMNERLDVPQPARSRVLLEIAAGPTDPPPFFSCGA